MIIVPISITSITSGAEAEDAAALRAADGASGFVLVTVLFVLAFLSLAAATASRAVQTRLALARNEIENARAEAYADAGATLGALRIAANARTQAPLEREDRRCRFEDGTLLVLSFEDEAGRIDLNLADETLLAALISGLGLPPGEAQARAEAILDYRDSDGTTRALGAESAAYAELGLAPPKNAPFDTIAEIARVAGIDAELARRLMPYITVHASQPGLDIGAANPALVGLLKRGFEQGGGLPDAIRNRSQRRTYTIRAEAVTRSGSRFVREAVAGLAAADSGRVHVPAAPPLNPDGSIAARMRSDPREDADRNPQRSAPAVRFLAWRQGATPAGASAERRQPLTRTTPDAADVPPC